MSRLLCRITRQHFLAALLSLAAVDLNGAVPDANPAVGRLQEKLENTVRQTLAQFSRRDLKPENLAVTVINLRDASNPLQASYRGHVKIYPASVVKLFYLVALHEWLETGKLRESDELRRARRDMIVDSSNEATHYIIDVLTGTTSGPELPPVELEEWYQKRNAVNRYFTSVGYTNINVNRKPWCEGPYGRESQSVKVHQPNHRNWLTTDATARLLTEIVSGKSVSAPRSAEMMTLLARDPFSTKASADGQARAYTGRALSPGDKLWSKAGWTSEARHDAAYVETSSGAKMVIVTFTIGHAAEPDIIRNIAREMLRSGEHGN